MNRYMVEVWSEGKCVRVAQAGNNKRKAESEARYWNRVMPMITEVRVIRKGDPGAVYQLYPGYTREGHGREVFRILRVYSLRRNRVINRYYRNGERS